MNTLLSKIFLPVGLFLLAFTIMSNSGGRAGAANGTATLAPGESTSTCANPSCHGTNSYDPSLTVEVSDSDGNLVTEYTLDQSYTVKLSITAGSGTPIGYGFQMVSLDGNDNAYNAWSTDLPGGTQVVELSNGREYFEHFTRLPDNTFEIEWTAPAANQGDITFYAAGIAANGNGNTGGDGGANTTFTLSSPVMTDVSETFDDVNVALYPNPTSEFLTLDTDWKQGHISIYNHSGIQVLSFNSIPNKIETSTFTPGVYFLILTVEDQVITQKFNKI